MIRRATVSFADKPCILGEEQDGSSWKDAQSLCVDNVLPDSSNHTPRTMVKILYDRDNLYLHYTVKDRYVYAVHTNYQDPVCRDSCVEFFVQPRNDCGYFNFEVNCIGTLLLHYQESAAGGFGQKELKENIPFDKGESVEIETSIKKPVTGEICDDIEWRAAMRIPVKLMEDYVGSLAPLRGSAWRANFYKCGDNTSHPHWISWSPMPPGKPNFHIPSAFGEIKLA